MATGATEYIDATTADAYIAELWSQEAIIAREAALVFATLATRKYESEMSYGDTLHVPSVGNLAAAAKDPSNNAAITYETVTETNVDITVATWNYSAVAIQSMQKIQVSQDLIKRYAPKQGYALGLQVDDDLAALVDDFSQTVGTLTQENTYSQVLRARQYLNDANAPMTGRAFVVSPAAEKGFMELDKFVDAERYGKLQGEVTNSRENGFLGSWLRIPVYMSTNVEGSNAAGHDNGLFQEEAIALVMQMKPVAHEFFDVDRLAHKFVVEQLYGVKEMRDDHGVWVAGA